MVLTDPIGDMLSRIMNAVRVGHSEVEMPSSVIKTKIAETLKQEGYISKFEVSSKGSKKTLKLSFKKNVKMKNAINMMKRVSSPGRHLYVKSDNIPRVQSGFGTAVVSTSKGIMPDKEARKLKIGGEVLFYVW